MDDIQLRAKRNKYFNSILFISLIMYIYKLYKLNMTTVLFPLYILMPFFMPKMPHESYDLYRCIITTLVFCRNMTKSIKSLATVVKNANNTEA